MKTFLAKIYAFKFFDDFILIYPLYAVMFTDFGTSPWQFGMLLTSWSLTAFLLEVPSGVWADKYSRKHILIIGQLIRAVGYGFWLFMPTFIGFLVGFILWGVKSALTSGTFEALVYDELKRLKKEEVYAKILGRTKSIYFMAILLANVLASLGILMGYSFVLVLSIASVLLAGLSIITLPPAKKVESTHETEYFQLLKKGLFYSYHHKPVWRLILFLSLAVTIGAALDEFWPIFANQAGLPKYGLGVFVAAISLTQGVASYFAYKFENKSDWFFYLLYSLNGGLLLVAAYLFQIAALALILIYSSVFTLMSTIFEARLQHQIPSSIRATVSSVKSFFLEVGAMTTFGGFSLLAEWLGYQKSFMIYGGLIMGIGVFYLFYFLCSKKLNKQLN